MTTIATPDQVYGDLFFAVQTSDIFEDSKTFVDCIAKRDPQAILRSYHEQKNSDRFELRQFVLDNFNLPEIPGSDFEADANRSVRDHIELLWEVLRRDADDPDAISSRLPLPRPYIVPGGRFCEIYYWDSYFTMLGLAAAGKLDMVDNMVENFAWLIDRVGFIPNGNRTYFCSRSQPPFFALMVELLAQHSQSGDIYRRFFPQIAAEYDFWMSGAEDLAGPNTVSRRVVKVNNAFLNRYWDDSDQPRQESYREDIELAEAIDRNTGELYRDVRAVCESGWDFSSRWFADANDMSTVMATRIIPVDLNCLLYKTERVLEHAATVAGDAGASKFYRGRADSRLKLLQTLFFDKQEQVFKDIGLDLQPSASVSIAAAFPLFLKLATQSQANAVAERFSREFLKVGGWVTTNLHTGQQWDAPNGWAPMQWVTYQGLLNYGFTEQAREGAVRWTDNNLVVYRNTGKLIEKYNVEEIGKLAGGGEYTVQDGFGWTNGVLLNFLNILGR